MIEDLVYLTVVFCVSIGILYAIVSSAPVINDEANLRNFLKFPSTLDETKSIIKKLIIYKDKHRNYIIILFSAAYTFKQTYSVPGSLLMNLIAGAVFGFNLGFPLICILNTVGASLCYIISWKIGSNFCKNYLGNQLMKIQLKIANRSRISLFSYLLASRLLPISPNWLLNICSPHVGVPIYMFVLSILFGLMPYNFITVQAGTAIEGFSTEDLTSWSNLSLLFSLFIIVLSPNLILKYCKRMQDTVN